MTTVSDGQHNPTSGEAAVARDTPPRFDSYAQNGEDVLLHRCFADRQSGFWIDVGAWHPESDSVTYAFSRIGWRGINIEPIPSFFDAFVERRPNDINLNVLVGSQPGDGTVFRVGDTGLSTTVENFAHMARQHGHGVERVHVSVATLDHIWETHVPADITVQFLKIDVEGAEAEVLAGLDLRRHRPEVLVIEANLPNERSVLDVSWEPGVLAADYRFVYYDGLNRWYVAAEHGELADHFRTPVNVFDNVHPARFMTLIEGFDQERVVLRTEIDTLRRRVDDLEAELAVARSAMAAPTPGLPAATERTALTDRLTRLLSRR